jgi:hypothetical protein
VKIPFFALIALSAILITGCEHSVNDSKPSVSDITFADVKDTVFPVCLPCHSGSLKSGGLDLSSANKIIDIPSTGVPAIVQIRPAKPDSSYVYLKVIGASNIVGIRMPQGGTLSDDKVTILRNWILEGAH